MPILRLNHSISTVTAVGIIIATIGTTVANNIHKSGIPPERSLLTGERGQGRATTDSTEGKKWNLVKLMLNRDLLLGN